MRSVRWRANGRVLFTLFLLSYLLIACSLINRGAEPGGSLGDTTPLADGATAVLTCSQTCARYNQCGTLADGGEVILAGAAKPMTLSHDSLLPAGQQVIVQTSLNQTILLGTEGTPGSLLFYNVILADASKAGWVAGYCVAAP